jgi:hypothetical protein
MGRLECAQMGRFVTMGVYCGALEEVMTGRYPMTVRFQLGWGM